MQSHPASSTATVNSEWRLHYATGDGVLVDSSNNVLERYPLQTVSNLRLSNTDPDIVLGDVHYIRQNGHPLTLNFQSKLETNRTSHQDDSALHLKIRLMRYCFLGNKAYHLPSKTLSIIPYTLIPCSTAYVNINVNEALLIVSFTEQRRFRRPLDHSEYFCSNQITVPIQRTLLGYTYVDEQRQCYPNYRLRASYKGYELVKKNITDSPIPYTLIKTGQMDQTSLEHIAVDRVAVNVTEEWFRPKKYPLIQLSRRIELSVNNETSYQHDDVNLCSTKSTTSFVEYHSGKLKLSASTETVAYEELSIHPPHRMFRSNDGTTSLAKSILYKRPDGSFYMKQTITPADCMKQPISPADDNGFVLL